MLKKEMFVALAIVSLSIFDARSRASGSRKLGCTISGFEYDEGRIMLTCAGDATTYYGLANGAACSFGIDTIKVWVSMIQSQMLSGRTIEMWVNDAATCGVPVIGSVKMNQS